MKAAQNITDAIKARTRVPLHRLLTGLSIDHMGEETARVIADHFGTLKQVRAARVDELSSINGVGEVVARSLYEWMQERKNKESLDALLGHITVESSDKKDSGRLAGKTMVFTGTLETIGRDKAKEIAREAGATVASSISTNTDFLIAGAKAGSKLKKAAEYNVNILSEKEFLSLLEN